jgi:outer membrane receptor for ferrienterochelin and colicin
MKVCLFIFFIAFPCLAFSQTVKGRVVNDSKVPLQGATVSWLNIQKAVTTNEAGEFSINMPANIIQTLLVSYVGYKTDTIHVNGASFLEISLKRNNSMNDVVIHGSRQAQYIASSPIKTEVISSLELKKAACCDLAGCFETQSTVLPQTTNIITNSKELRILGLSGIYNQVLVDGFPQIYGLSYTYGISSIPGPLVENIWVAKGANSVLQGFESISGQINVITKEPAKADKLLLNGYLNSFGEKQFNVLHAFKKKKWSNLTALHVVQPSSRVDNDDDTFLDLPLLTRYMISNRLQKGDEAEWGWSTQISVRYLSERRVGGQRDFDFNNDKGSAYIYGQAVQINQPEVWLKTAYRMNDEHRFAFYTSGFHHDQKSFFGITNYNAKQSNAYANLQYEYSYKDNSSLKAGFSYRHVRLNERISFLNNSLGRSYSGAYSKKEDIPGAFAETTLNLFDNKITWIAGIRADNHNDFGWQITPRTLIKYSVTDNLTLRGSLGKGWRTANIFSENIGLLASSRDIILIGTLLPEKATNLGLNATQKFKGKSFDGYLSLDFYRTNFKNQLFPDYDVSPTKAFIQNFNGKSVSNGFQAEVSATVHSKFSGKIGYVYLDVYQDRSGIKNTLPFNPRHRFNGSASFMPLNKKWHLDANIHWFGKQRLPDTKNNPVIYQMPEHSNPYTTLNSQFTYTVKMVELYVGAENLFNFRQNKPIMGWRDPFGEYFDTQFVWGPTRGREAYVGFRYTLK